MNSCTGLVSVMLLAAMAGDDGGGGRDIAGRPVEPKTRHDVSDVLSDDPIARLTVGERFESKPALGDVTQLRNHRNGTSRLVAKDGGAAFHPDVFAISRAQPVATVTLSIDLACRKELGDQRLEPRDIICMNQRRG